MKRMIFTVLAVLGALTAFSAPASAAASPTLACQVIGNTTGSTGGVSTGQCSTFRADSSYVLDFGVRNGFPSYSWTTPPGVSIVAGCNSGTAFCDLVVRSSSVERSYTVSVLAFDADGVLRFTSATATTPEVCGKFLC